MDIENRKYIDLLDLFMRGSTSLEEEQDLLDWIKRVGVKDEIFSFYLERWNDTSADMPIDVQLRVFDSIQEKIGETEASPNQELAERKYSIGSYLRRYAAIASLLVLVAVGSYYFTQESLYSPKEFIVSVDKGQKASLTLPDGTLIWLNSASKIKYDNAYNSNERRLVLDGEAYFEVAKDKDKPFIVRANNIDIEALGTSFNVKSYQTDKDIAVTLVEGKLKVSDETTDAYLMSNERIIYNKNSRGFDKKSTYDVSNIAVWRNNELAFYDETLENIGAVLSRIYNIDIVFTSESAKYYSFSGVIKNNSLSNVLEIIGTAAPIKYKIYNDTIEISTNR